MPLDAFHPTLRRWFETELGAPSAPQVRGWPLIRAGRNVLIAAPTGTGKTLAAFFTAIDQLVRSPDVVEVDGARVLPDEMRVLYISPLKALGNDVQKNLQAPLARLRELDPTLPNVRVLVRTGDTPQHERQAMRRRPPHILVTTPESLYLLLTSAGGREMLAKIRTVIVDEIHALVGDKRGSHLALSLERLEALVSGMAFQAMSPASHASERDRTAQTASDLDRETHPIASNGDMAWKAMPRLQRIGLSATQKPIDAVARFLVGNDPTGARRDCAIVDIGHKRDLDLAIEIPRSPLATVCEHEVWDEVYQRITALVEQHTSTLVFVNTRMMAERVARKLSETLGRDAIASHHGSLARERRLDAEQRLKEGRLRALVATASLELGIDIGDVDLVIQLGPTFSIAQFLQRVGRAGHALAKTPKGRLFPLTIDEAFVCCALLLATRRGELDRVPIPLAPLDILAQQIVAETALTTWSEDELFHSLTRAMPYADLSRDVFDGVITRLAEGRGALLHRDGVNGRVHGTKRARLTAIFSGGAIPDNADVPVILTPDDAKIGTVFEDFVVESYVGDVFQLGNASWRIVKIEPGALRVADAGGAPPNLPFWIAEAPSHTAELVTATTDVIALVARPSRPCPPQDDQHDPLRTDTETATLDRARTQPDADGSAAEQTGDKAWKAMPLLAELPEAREVAPQLVEYISETLATLGEVPSQTCIIAERFFDETGGTHIVVHAPFGGRIVRAIGHAMRMALMARFGGEVQAATIQNAILISLGPHVSFPLIDLLREFVRPDNARGLLLKSLPASPMFRARWRHNITRSLLLERNRNGKRVPTPLLRMRADDALVQEILRETGSESIDNVPLDALVGDEHEARAQRPILWQTVHDCFAEAMDVEGALAVLQRVAANEIRTVAVDVPEPSPPARAAMTALPYAFLDAAPLEERRTQAVQARHRIDARLADNVGALLPEAVAQVREQAWPDPESAEQVHEALLWMGYVTSAEADEHGWTEWLGELEGGRRVQRQSLDEAIRIALLPVVGDGAWFATEVAQGERDPRELVRGRLQALGPVLRDEGAAVEEHLASLEREGAVMRTRLDGEEHWCDRRLLARIHRYTLDRLRAEIKPVSASMYMAFLAHWQHVAPGSRLEGPQAVNVLVDQLAGFEIPAAAWEASVLPSRLRLYKRDWLDTATLTGAIAWGRLWGQGSAPIRTTPIALVPRADLETWLAMSTPPDPEAMSGTARDLAQLLRERSAMFPTELERAITLLPSHREMALGELVAHGVATCDAFGGLRQLIVPPGKRRQPVGMTGRWTLLHREPQPVEEESTRGPRRENPHAEFAARALLKRYGILFRRLLERERIPVPWRDIVMVLRALELRGDVRGGRFVTGFTGEQYGLPDAVTKLRKLRRDGELGDASPSSVKDPAAKPELSVGAGDPLNLAGILTEDARVSPTSRKRVAVATPRRSGG